MNENYQLMQTFLDIIKELAISNPSIRIEENFIYTNLMGYDITPDKQPYKDTTDILNALALEYQNNDNLKMIRVQHFLAFDQSKLNGNEIKLYVPLDKNHMEKGSKELINFLLNNNISTQIKFADKVRNDNVVIRVNTLEDAEEIINFVNSNEYIKEGLLKVNPFLPNAYGVGITMDNSHSYNAILAGIIDNYIAVLRTKGKIDELSVEGLNSFIKEQAKTITDLDLKDIYNLLSKTTSKEFKFEDFSMHAKNKIADKYDENWNRIVDPKYYFEAAVNATYKKHPNNVKTAILSYIEGNAQYFTNEDNVRIGLIKHVEPRNIVNIMRTQLMKNNVPVPSNTEVLISSYLNQLLVSKENEKKEILRDTKKDIGIPEILRAAYINTYKKYGKIQADSALKEFIKSSQIKHFTNEEGYRDKLKNNLAKINPKKMVLSEIDLSGLDYNNIDQIVSRYAESLAIYTNEPNKVIY